MKKRLIIVFSAVFITLFSVIASYISVFANNKDNMDMVLREYNGSVALYKGNEIIEIYDEIVIGVLPDTDRKLLKEGIVIENEEQLSRIIEDYDG